MKEPWSRERILRVAPFLRVGRDGVDLPGGTARPNRVSHPKRRRAEALELIVSRKLRPLAPFIRRRIKNKDLTRRIPVFVQPTDGKDLPSSSGNSQSAMP